MSRKAVVWGLACGLALGLLLPLLARAGNACGEQVPRGDSVAKAMDLALKTRQALDASGAQVALLARAGQDLTKYGLRFSHMAFVWRDHPRGRWLVVHMLNNCGTALSDLYDQGLGNFFLDDMFSWETKIVIPSPEAQAKLLKFLASQKPNILHNPQYNMVAYPFSTRYQNSNQWLLETWAAAHLPELGESPRVAAQAWLQARGFQPETLEISATTRLGGRMFRANVAFDDHPFGRRMAGKIDVVSVESVLRFVSAQDRGSRELLLRLP